MYHLTNGDQIRHGGPCGGGAVCKSSRSPAVSRGAAYPIFGIPLFPRTLL